MRLNSQLSHQIHRHYDGHGIGSFSNRYNISLKLPDQKPVPVAQLYMITNIHNLQEVYGLRVIHKIIPSQVFFVTLSPQLNHAHAHRYRYFRIRNRSGSVPGYFPRRDFYSLEDISTD